MERNLHTFVETHEHKLQAKVEAATQDRRRAAHHLRVDGLYNPPSHAVYDSVLEHRYGGLHRIGQTPQGPYMHYEYLPRA